MYECPVTQPMSAAHQIHVGRFFEIEDELVRRGDLREVAAGRSA